MFEGVDSAERTPASRSSRRGRPPRARPRRGVRGRHGVIDQLNTVWSAIFEPLPTFGFLDRLGKESTWGARHALGYHVVGSDASGVVLKVGSAVRNWKPGAKVTVHCNYVDDQDPSSHDDSMLAANQRIWGFETNFGGLAEIAVVKANQLMPKPTHLSGRSRPSNALCNSTSYRMLVSKNGAGMSQGDRVLVWGASGGLGSYAVQYVLNGGGIPLGVVSSPREVSCSTTSVLTRSSTARRRLPLLGSTNSTGRVGVRRFARMCAASSARTPTSSSSTRGARQWAPRCSWPSAAA